MVSEQAEVAPERNQRRVLVVHLHTQRAIGLLADLGDRIERRLVEVFGRHDRHPRHHDRPGFTLLAALELLGDDLIGPGHRLADAAKAELLELANVVRCPAAIRAEPKETTIPQATAPKEHPDAAVPPDVSRRLRPPSSGPLMTAAAAQVVLAPSQSAARCRAYGHNF